MTEREAKDSAKNTAAQRGHDLGRFLRCNPEITHWSDAFCSSCGREVVLVGEEDWGGFRTEGRALLFDCGAPLTLFVVVEEEQRTVTYHVAAASDQEARMLMSEDYLYDLDARDMWQREKSGTGVIREIREATEEDTRSTAGMKPHVFRFQR